MLRKTLWAAASVLLLASAQAHGDDKASEAEKAVQYRKAVFAAMGYNFKPLAGMVKGEIAWDNAEFVRRAKRVQALAEMPWEGFQEGTADVGHSEAKAVIWDKGEEFRKLQDQLAKRTDALVQAAESGDRNSVRMRFKKVGKTCKSCHDDFKEDDH
jgi:cytochrome c556